MKRLTYDFEIGGNHCWQVKGADNLECREVCERQGDNGCKTCPISKAFDRLAAYEDILGEEYELDRLRELVELYSNVPHICDYCIGCEIEPADGHGCDGIYDNFVFSIRRIVAALKAREQDGNNK